MPKVTTNGIEMYYEERGSGDPVICIMGITAPGAVCHSSCNIDITRPVPRTHRHRVDDQAVPVLNEKMGPTATSSARSFF